MQIRILLVSGMALVLAACGSNEEAPSQPRAYGDAPDAETIALGERPKSFSQCAVCHSVEPGENGMGPTLAGVFGAKAGHIADFAYSTPMRESGITWDEASLDAYLANPQGAVPGTKMSYGGLRDEQKRAAIIAYLKAL